MRPRKVMASEILPNLVSPLTVEAGLRLTYSIIIMAGLAFLGFGQQPPAANWGLMINENRTGLPLNPWAVIVPVILIALLTIGTNTFTDAFARVAIGVDRPPEEAALIDELGQERAERAGDAAAGGCRERRDRLAGGPAEGDRSGGRWAGPGPTW